MYTLFHEGEALGGTVLESADPESHSISGRFNNTGGPIVLSAWIMSNSGTEEGDIVYLNLAEEFQLKDAAGEKVVFDESTLIAIPDENEAFIEIIIRDKSVYDSFLAEHETALSARA